MGNSSPGLGQAEAGDWRVQRERSGGTAIGGGLERVSSALGGSPQGDHQAQATGGLTDRSLDTWLVHGSPCTTVQATAAEKQQQNLAKGARKRNLWLVQRPSSAL